MSKNKSNERAESAIDTIYSLVSMVETLDKRITIIDSNIKLLNNKFSKLTKSVNDSKFSINNISHGEGPRNVIINEEEEDDAKLVLGNITMFGYIIDMDRKPIENVSVNVYDGSNDLIKDIKTNRDGHWTVRLPSGKYLVKYIMDGFKDIKRTVELTNNMKRYEVK